MVVEPASRRRPLPTVVPVSFVRFKIGGGDHSGFVVDPSTYPKVVNLGECRGASRLSGRSTMAVSLPGLPPEGLAPGQAASCRLRPGRTRTVS